MKIGIYQYDVFWLDHHTNIEKIVAACKSLTGEIDLLVLPEMFNTGYTMDPGSDIDIITQEETLDSINRLALEYQMVICGSIPMCRDGIWYNSFLFFNGISYESAYDKIHLFNLAGEANSYEAGTEINHSEFGDGWTIQPLICYDLRFPYISYQLADKEIIIYSANWPETRIHHWRTLLQARAIENQCYVIGVNRIGQDANGYNYNGSSVIVDFNGDIIVDCGTLECVKTATLDQELLQNYRKKLPFLGDRV
jgi:omega-amidase